MHKSRIGALFIDHPSSSFQASMEFWAAATGHEREPGKPESDPYRLLGRFTGELLIGLQRTDDDTPARTHVDIDTDDVEAEVRRLEGLGARRLKDCGRHWQMVDPGGVVFCVIPPHTPDFDEHATVWE